MDECSHSQKRNEHVDETPLFRYMMLRKETSFLTIGLVLGALLTALTFVFIQRSHSSRGGGQGDVLVLKLGHSLDQAHPVHAAMEFMGKRLDELSNGSVELQIFPEWSVRLGTRVH